jgi:hypothetical protein
MGSFYRECREFCCRTRCVSGKAAEGFEIVTVAGALPVSGH